MWGSLVLLQATARRLREPSFQRVMVVRRAQQQLGREAGRHERPDQHFDMAPVLGFDDDIELGTFDRGIVKQPLVMHFYDVAGVLTDHPR